MTPTKPIATTTTPGSAGRAHATLTDIMVRRKYPQRFDDEPAPRAPRKQEA